MDALDHELLAATFDHLDLRNLVQASGVCSKWRRFAKQILENLAYPPGALPPPQPLARTLSAEVSRLIARHLNQKWCLQIEHFDLGSCLYAVAPDRTYHLEAPYQGDWMQVCWRRVPFSPPQVLALARTGGRHRLYLWAPFATQANARVSQLYKDWEYDFSFRLVRDRHLIATNKKQHLFHHWDLAALGSAAC